MKELITVQSVTISYLIWYGVCVFIYHILYKDKMKWLSKILGAITSSVMIPLILTFILGGVWFLFNALVGNFN